MVIETLTGSNLYVKFDQFGQTWLENIDTTTGETYSNVPLSKAQVKALVNELILYL